MRTEQRPPWRGFSEFFNPFHSQPKELRPNRRIPVMSIPARQAYLCVNCDTVHTSARCPSCDKGPSMPLKPWLDSKKEH